MTLASLSPESADGLARVKALSLEAGRAIIELYEHPSSSEAKADKSPVTAADRAAHRVLVDGLAATWPDIPIVSEEGKIPDSEIRRHWQRFWLVDPLDGTKEYLSRNGEFTVNVALISGGEPVMGVVHAPALGLTYCALRGYGALRQTGMSPEVRIQSRPKPTGEALVVVESRSHPSAALESWIKGIHVAKRVQAGSSLKLCWVADGQADVYPRFGPTMEWDVAAGDCVYRVARAEAGPPSPLTYNKPDLRNTDFVLGL